MQPLKITIHGRFWDSQLYKGRLYLFDLEGSLQQLDWNELVQSIHVPERCRLALECGFQRSDYLYGDRWEKLFSDPEVAQLLRSKFEELQKQDLTIDTDSLSTLVGTREETPFPYAHNDSLIYKDQLYATSQSGVFSQSVTDSNTPSANVLRLWDAPVSALDISHDVIALAAGDEGLYRSPTVQHFEDWTNSSHDLQNVSKRFCNDCSYISSSILAFGYDSGASLVEFRSPKRDAERTDEAIAQEYWQSKSIGTVEDTDIFPEDTRGGFAWGSKNRMCLAKDGTLYVAQYATTNPRRRRVAKQIRKWSLDAWKGRPVSGDNAVFGAILEMDNCLVVIRSDDTVDTLKGEPTNWRVFPKSKYYTNQLHVVYEDRIEILSFNHDYFVNQKSKAFGEPQLDHRSHNR